MKTQSSSAVALLLAFAAWIVSMPVADAVVVTIIENGGFETGDFTEWSAPSPNQNPWSLVSTRSHGGQFSAMCPDLGYAISQTTLFQNVSPIYVEDIVSAGYWYYIARATPEFNPAFATLLTFADGTSVQDSVLTSDSSYRLNEWAFRDWKPTLSANPGKILVQVGFFPQFSDVHYVDDVTVVGTPAVPEPSMFALLGVWTTALMIVRRRR